MCIWQSIILCTKTVFKGRIYICSCFFLVLHSSISLLLLDFPKWKWEIIILFLNIYTFVLKKLILYMILNTCVLLKSKYLTILTFLTGLGPNEYRFVTSILAGTIPIIYNLWDNKHRESLGLLLLQWFNENTWIREWQLGSLTKVANFMD